MHDYTQLIQNAMSHCLIETDLTIGSKYRGKVRDVYDLGDTLMLITTDRQSAFDRVLASIPYKGQVLNLISAWWFKKTRHIIPNHLISTPDPNVIIAKKCTVFPIEFVVRNYITGTTNTSLWTQYQNGVRDYCGHHFPEGLKKNQKLPSAILTPTTKDPVHDKAISEREIIQTQLMTEEEWKVASSAALRLFEFGVKTAKQHGLILVDTKYEMGRDADGNIMLIDEVHTPDSSRYWLEKSYAQRFAEGQEPENIDKEFLRLWFAEQCDPYQDTLLPEAPEALVVTLSSRYIQLYELITGMMFPFPQGKYSVLERIKRNIDRKIVQDLPC
ncbi:phosphoribosylaminoimidazolesuccinocarboxamide synthase [Legionella sp.]|uniref:phosphoribosylaminoimidazolesuccinocarboxamide synthase n=1 Tax=Legionella sp. TaxID=459 RepID=UPI003C91E524